MAVSADNRPARMRSVLAAVLTILVLVPTGYLFLSVWQDNDDAWTQSDLERKGVEYLTALSPLVSALCAAEASAVRGNPAAPASLTTAVTQVGAADQRLGEALQTRERWAGLRDKIGRLPGVAGDPQTVLRAHVEVADLTLALYNAVRNNSGLVRDPDNDLSHMQQAIAVDLPGTVIAVNRMGTLALLLAQLSAAAGRQDQDQDNGNRPSEAQRAQAQQAVQALGAQFAATLQGVGTSVASLTDNLQAAVDDTNSPTLSGNLVTSLDGFRRGVEALTKGANPGGAPAPDVMANAQTQLQAALTSLSEVSLREMDDLLAGRLDNLDQERVEALIALAAAVILALVAIVIGLTGRRYATGPPPGVADTGRGPASDRGYGGTLEPTPSFGAVNPTRRERSSALR